MIAPPGLVGYTVMITLWFSRYVAVAAAEDRANQDEKAADSATVRGSRNLPPRAQLI
jgi:hypothetical protein